MTRTFADRGGTFTDVVVVDAGAVRAQKVRSDRAVLGELAEGALTFGTTVVTNALLEGRGARTALFVTRGFADLVQIRHMARPDLFDADRAWPEPLSAFVIEVDGRIGADGAEVLPLQAPALDALADPSVRAVAVALLHANLKPDHERRIAAEIRAVRPDLYVVCGHELCPLPGYLARIETTLLDAALTPALQAALRADAIPDGALAIRSDGSLIPAASLRACDAVLSGPAGGALAVSAIVDALGLKAAIGLDMGGTSTDVVLVTAGGLPPGAPERPLAGRIVGRPSLWIDTIAAGGGSEVWRDAAWLRVGPQSAGASPGPQCFGAGGPPTITDAALAAGCLDPMAFEPPLQADRIHLPAAPEAALAIAQGAMAAAVQRLAGAWGVDPAALPLVAYGGAAGQHAAGVADRLGAAEVWIHPLASVLSAWGQQAAVRRDRATRAIARPIEVAWDGLDEVIDALTASLPARAVRRVWLELGEIGTSTTITLRPEATFEATLTSFRDRWAELFGHRGAGAVEIHAVHVDVADAPAEVAWPRPPALSPTVGPARLTLDGTTVWIPPGWSAAARGPMICLTRQPDAPAPPIPAEAALASWAARLMSVAERAGEHLQRLARSVSVRERRDFSVALFNREGQLVVNAPHVPVHLGAMGDTVRDLLLHHPDAPPGSAWLTNDPAAGGSHLPDLTVITPIELGGCRFFIASRAHHADVGGKTPGSMPPDARALSEEGAVVRRAPLWTDDALTPPPALLAASRQPDVVVADLAAQVGANALGARLLAELGPGEQIEAWMARLLDAAAHATRQLPPLDGEADDDLDGVPLRVRLLTTSTGLRVDFTGTGGPHAGNLNAPRGVVRAAALYALRLLAGDLPLLNEGTLAPVELVLPPGSVVDPPAGAAVAGGNVETSQRLVDLILRAAGARAAGQGTMNNLTLGFSHGALYETIGGGGGASRRCPGLSGLQVHMTNTRATDPEVLERRFPVRLWRVALRGGSGGRGAQPGGDGLDRAYELLAPATASLLAAWRPAGAPGMHGGGNGAPGEAWIGRPGAWTPWRGETRSLAAGDHILLRTPGGGGWGEPVGPANDAE